MWWCLALQLIRLQNKLASLKTNKKRMINDGWKQKRNSCLWVKVWCVAHLLSQPPPDNNLLYCKLTFVFRAHVEMTDAVVLLRRTLQFKNVTLPPALTLDVYIGYFRLLEQMRGYFVHSKRTSLSVQCSNVFYTILSAAEGHRKRSLVLLF